MEITQEELMRVFDYDQKTGIFINKIERKSASGAGRSAKRGAIAGFKHSKGYVAITVNGRCYLAHRLAWIYVHGTLPAFQIDHIDGNRRNNAISNLRACTASENMQNVRKYKDGGYSNEIGVSFNKRTNAWHGYVKVNGKQINGSSKTEQGAIEIRRNLKIMHHTFNPVDRSQA